MCPGKFCDKLKKKIARRCGKKSKGSRHIRCAYFRTKYMYRKFRKASRRKKATKKPKSKGKKTAKKPKSKGKKTAKTSTSKGMKKVERTYTKLKKDYSRK